MEDVKYEQWQRKTRGKGRNEEEEERNIRKMQKK